MSVAANSSTIAPPNLSVQNDDLSDRLKPLIALAIDAGRIIIDLRDAGVGWRHKDDGSVVTRADEAAEDLIVSGLFAHDPDAVVVAEERVARGDVPDANHDFYLVDALDGTSEYVNGRDEFTVNIARVIDGFPVLGVVVCPALKIGFAGDTTGAWTFSLSTGGIAECRAIRAREPDLSKPTAVVSRSHASPETHAFVDAIGDCECVSYGSSLKLCRLADGSADVYPRLGRTMEWDIAAGHAVLAASGGRVLTADGRDLTYGKVVQPHDTAYANPHFVAFSNWPHEDCIRLAGTIA